MIGMKHSFKIIFKIFTPLRVAIILGLGIFFWFLIFGEQGIIELNKLISMRKQLTEQKVTLDKDIKQLSQEKILLNNPKKLELVIRQELGFIKPGEVIYQKKENSSP